MNLFNGRSLFEGDGGLVTEQFLRESNQDTASIEAVKKRFQEIGIFEAEQLIAITSTESQKSLLVATVGLGDAIIETLIEKSKNEL